MNIHNILQKLTLGNGLLLREETAEDQLFLKALFSATREYLYALPLPKAQLDVLVQQQFLLQQSGYVEMFPQAVNCIIELDGQPIGRSILADLEGNLHIVDLAFSPRMCSLGHGTHLMRHFQQRAGEAGCAITLSVDNNNLRARQFYVAQGFKCIASSATHDSMCWQG
jgi:ribosomal protein S18 acetylase RimI-like enzyme